MSVCASFCYQKLSKDNQPIKLHNCFETTNLHKLAFWIFDARKLCKLCVCFWYQFLGPDCWECVTPTNIVTGLVKSVSNLNHWMYVAFRSSKLRWIFDSNEDNEVEIVPHVVLLFAVFLEWNCLVVKRRPFQTYKAHYQKPLNLQSQHYHSYGIHTEHFHV